ARERHGFVFRRLRREADGARLHAIDDEHADAEPERAHDRGEREEHLHTDAHPARSRAQKPRNDERDEQDEPDRRNGDDDESHHRDVSGAEPATRKPTPRTVSITAGSAPTSESLRRNALTCESTVRSVIAKPSPHTRSMSCARVNTRPGLCTRHASRSNPTRVSSSSRLSTYARRVSSSTRMGTSAVRRA